MFGQYVQWDAGWQPLESVAKRKNKLKSSQMFNNGSVFSRLPRVSASQQCRHRVLAPPRITFDVIRLRSGGLFQLGRCSLTCDLSLRGQMEL